MFKDSRVEQFAYTNPSSEQTYSQAPGSLDSGVTCRVDILPRQLPSLQVSRNGTMAPTQNTNKGNNEEGVRFLLPDEDDEALVIYPISEELPTSSPTSAGILVASPSYCANFDELFEGTNRFQYPLPPTYHRSQSDNDFYTDKTIEIEIGDSKKREDGIHLRMSQSTIRQLVRESWESTSSYTSFHRRLGPYLNDKYCMRLKIHATIFMFLYVLYGATLISAATFIWNGRPGSDPMIGAYLIATGVLSVFLFPILIMEWAPRIGGCIEDQSPLENVSYFAVALFLRICACAAGTVCVYYRYDSYFGVSAIPEFTSRQWKCYFLFASVSLDWLAFFGSIVVPSCCFSTCYLCAKSKLFATVKKKPFIHEDLTITRE